MGSSTPAWLTAKGCMDTPFFISRAIGVRDQMKVESEKGANALHSDSFGKRRAEEEDLREGLSLECSTVAQEMV